MPESGITQKPLGKQRSACRAVEGGLSMRVLVPDVMNCPSACERVTGQLVDQVARETSVAVHATVHDGDAAGLHAFCTMLARALHVAGLPASSVELGVDAASMSPELVVGIRRRTLGPGVVNLLADGASFARRSLSLWRLRSVPGVRVAAWPSVRSACVLLGAESAGDVLPVSGLQVPAASAWATVTLPLAEYAEPGACGMTPALREALDGCLASADALHDTARWPSAALRQDAWLNRRVAVVVDGIGDYVQTLGLDPSEHATLAMLDALIADLRQHLVAASAAAVSRTEILPAITAASPRTDSDATGEWQRRWLHAVRRAALRHRNLVALSPWSLFPTGNADLAYANLLPVLRHADACGFAGAHALDRWNVKDFSYFYGRIDALLRRIRADSVVAERL